MTNRRGFVGGLAALVAAPAIVRVSSLMPLRGERLVNIATRLPLVVGVGNRVVYVPVKPTRRSPKRKPSPTVFPK